MEVNPLDNLGARLLQEHDDNEQKQGPPFGMQAGAPPAPQAPAVGPQIQIVPNAGHQPLNAWQQNQNRSVLSPLSDETTLQENVRQAKIYFSAIEETIKGLESNQGWFAGTAARATFNRDRYDARQNFRENGEQLVAPIEHWLGAEIQKLAGEPQQIAAGLLAAETAFINELGLQANQANGKATIDGEANLLTAIDAKVANSNDAEKVLLFDAGVRWLSARAEAEKLRLFNEIAQLVGDLEKGTADDQAPVRFKALAGQLAQINNYAYVVDQALQGNSGLRNSLIHSATHASVDALKVLARSAFQPNGQFVNNYTAQESSVITRALNPAFAPLQQGSKGALDFIHSLIDQRALAPESTTQRVIRKSLSGLAIAAFAVGTGGLGFSARSFIGGSDADGDGNRGGDKDPFTFEPGDPSLSTQPPFTWGPGTQPPLTGESGTDTPSANPTTGANTDPTTQPPFTWGPDEQVRLDQLA